MKLEHKRALASRALSTGKSRIVFNSQRLNEIKEAITKQDIKDLKNSGAISIKEAKGRKKIVRRRTRRRDGSVRKKVNTRKKDYATLTRKLRSYVRNLKLKGKISNEDFLDLRKETRDSVFKSLSHMKERISILENKEEKK